jgi:hypothetical protein
LMNLTCSFRKFYGLPAQWIFFKATGRFVDSASRFLEDTLPNAVETVVQAPVEVADSGVVAAAHDVGKAVGHVVEGVGGVAAEGVKVVATVAEDAATVVATPIYEVGMGVKEIIVDTPLNLGGGEVVEAGKSLLHGAIVRPIRGVLRTGLNLVKGSVDTTRTVASSLFGGIGKLWKGISGAAENLFSGASKLATSIGKTGLAKKLKSGTSEGSSIGRWAGSLAVVGSEPKKKAKAHATSHESHDDHTEHDAPAHDSHPAPAAGHAAPTTAHAPAHGAAKAHDAGSHSTPDAHKAKAPAAGHSAPAAGHSAPAAGHGAPAVGHGAPAAGHGAPATGHSAPAAGH